MNMARISIFLIIVALIAGLAGCAQPAQYDLTISATEGGEITTPGDGTFSYEEGTEVPLVAFPYSGYRFVEWTGDVDTIDDVEDVSTSIVMDAAKIVVANFALLRCNLIVDSTDGGSVTTPGEGTYTYDYGTQIDLAVQSAEGYRFTRWTGHVDFVADVDSASTNVIMNDDFRITANFEELDPGTPFAGGSGTVGDPYQIGNWNHLDNVRDYPDGYFILIRDLHSTTAGYAELASSTADQGKGWQPIGAVVADQISYQIVDIVAPFIGSVNGQGYEIKDVFISRPDEDGVGLFGCVSGGVIENLGMVNAEVTGSLYVGSLVGDNEGTVSNSYSSGTVTGQLNVGGVAGVNPGNVCDSYSSSSVIGCGSVGGLTGENYGTVDSSYFTGSMTGNGSVGGLVGEGGGTMANSYYDYEDIFINGENIITTGALFAEDFEQWLANDKSLDVNERLSQEDDHYLVKDVSDFKQLLIFGQDATLKFRLTADLDLGDDSNFYIPYLAGGFDGNGHQIRNLRFNFDFIAQVGLFGYIAHSGEISQLGVENVDIAGIDGVGGLAGGNDGTVSNCYSTGSVSGGRHIGGLVGFNGGAVNNSYSSGSVTGSEYDAGGLVGLNQGGAISNSYSTCSVSGNDRVGGLVGYGAWDWGGTVDNSFWDVEIAGIDESDGGTGKTTAEMKNVATFSSAVWSMTAVANPSIRDPSYIWNIVDGQTYPFLSWQS